ncbi:hypothetical protein [Streptomyces sp. NPDC002133]|uniref:hypothetical protein n=1 Tax=Streptomyces sp. NPDC002133 TaxID=3154409 RepID=UPI0033212BCA
MRQLSAPGRCAVWIATVLTVAASAGCMSIGDDGGEGAPAKSPQQKGVAAEPDGGGAAQGGAGGHGRTGMGGAAQSGGAASKGGEDAGAGASPSASVAPSAQPPKGGGSGSTGSVKPADPQGPTPPAGEPTSSADPTPPAGEPTSSADPTPPGPDPSGEPTDPPSASPAADTQMGAMRAADENWEGARAEPTASPQMEPASRVRGPGDGRWM